MDLVMYPILNLPPDHLVIELIGKHLSFQDIFYLWSHPGGYAERAEKMLKGLEEINLAELKGLKGYDCYRALWISIKKNCRRLKKIVVHPHAILDKHFFEILYRNPLIEELDMSYCKIGYNGPFHFTLRKLKVFKMSNASPTDLLIQTICLYSRELTHVDLSMVTNQSYETINNCLKQLPKLRKVNLKGTRVIGRRMNFEMYDWTWKQSAWIRCNFEMNPNKPYGECKKSNSPSYFFITS